MRAHLWILAAVAASVSGHERHMRVINDHDHHDHEHDHHDHTTCDTPDPTEMDLLVMQGRMHQKRRRLFDFTCEELCKQCIEIDVQWNLLKAESDKGAFIPAPWPEFRMFLLGLKTKIDDFTEQDQVLQNIKDTMDVVNKAFADTPFKFNWISDTPNEVINNSYATNPFNHFEEIGTALGQGSNRKLDIYLTGRLHSNPRASLTQTRMGRGSFPNSQGPTRGIYIRYDTLVGGADENWADGYVLVHEIGHWLGLMHTFQVSGRGSNRWDPCNDSNLGDGVDDTPRHTGPSENDFACDEHLGENDETTIDTCPNSQGADPIWNHMNYLLKGTCHEKKGEFTCGQVIRMYQQWLLFREEVTNCESEDEMEIEVALQLDQNQNSLTQVTLEDTDGVIYLDSDRHTYSFYALYDNALFFDICVPTSKTYNLTLIDYSYDDFKGSLLVYQDRELIASIDDEAIKTRSIIIHAPVLDLGNSTDGCTAENCTTLGPENGCLNCTDTGNTTDCTDINCTDIESPVDECVESNCTESHPVCIGACDEDYGDCVSICADESVCIGNCSDSYIGCMDECDSLDNSTGYKHNCTGDGFPEYDDCMGSNSTDTGTNTTDDCNTTNFLDTGNTTDCVDSNCTDTSDADGCTGGNCTDTDTDDAGDCNTTNSAGTNDIDGFNTTNCTDTDINDADVCTGSNCTEVAVDDIGECAGDNCTETTTVNGTDTDTETEAGEP